MRESLAALILILAEWASWPSNSIWKSTAEALVNTKVSIRFKTVKNTAKAYDRSCIARSWEKLDSKHVICTNNMLGWPGLIDFLIDLQLS